MNGGAGRGAKGTQGARCGLRVHERVHVRVRVRRHAPPNPSHRLLRDGVDAREHDWRRRGDARRRVHERRVRMGRKWRRNPVGGRCGVNLVRINGALVQEGFAMGLKSMDTPCNSIHCDGIRKVREHKVDGKALRRRRRCMPAHPRAVSPALHETCPAGGKGASETARLAAKPTEPATPSAAGEGTSFGGFGTEEFGAGASTHPPARQRAVAAAAGPSHPVRLAVPWPAVASRPPPRLLCWRICRAE